MASALVHIVESSKPAASAEEEGIVVGNKGAAEITRARPLTGLELPAPLSWCTRKVWEAPRCGLVKPERLVAIVPSLRWTTR